MIIAVLRGCEFCGHRSQRVNKYLCGSYSLTVDLFPCIGVHNGSCDVASQCGTFTVTVETLPFLHLRALTKGKQKRYKKPAQMSDPKRGTVGERMYIQWSSAMSNLARKMSWYFSLKAVQVIGRRKYSNRKRVPEFTSGRKERMEILINSCIRELDRVRVRGRRKPSAARPWERGRHAVSKFRRAVSVKIAVEYRQRSNIAAEWQSLKRVSQRRRVDETKSFWFHLV